MRISDLSRTTRVHLAIQRDNKPPVSLAPKRCSCSKPAFAKQLAQFGKCVACVLADRVATIYPGDIDKLKHALGATQHRPKRTWGLRNYYCAGDEATEAMLRLVAAGFAREGATLERGSIYFHATRDGCKLAGLDSAGIKRAMEGR